MLTEEMVRCQQLGLTLFNIHPGSTCGKISRQEGIRLVAEGINRVHKETSGSVVKLVLENMCCQGRRPHTRWPLFRVCQRCAAR